jgi:malonyl-CoA O-methyltransferase
MLERLDYVKIDPRLVVDLGCGAGGALNALGERYPRARLVGIDACEAMLRVGHERRAQLRWLLPFLPGPKRSALIAADAQALPLAPGAAGLVWSNLMLHWLADPLAGLREAQRALETGGLLMFSTLGPDSLKEVRACFGDEYEHTLRFIDMHDYGDMLIGCGFADPVMDAERLTVTYPTAAALFAELRQTGSTCAAPGRRRGLMGRRTWQAACRAYERHADGRLPVTLEVIYGHAWKAEPRTAPDGRKVIRFAERE